MIVPVDFPRTLSKVCYRKTIAFIFYDKLNEFQG